MRLIDADEILTGIEELKISPWATEDYMCYHNLAVKEALEIVRDLCLNQAPTIDAVPVVRCKDCKYFTLSPYGCGKWEFDMEHGDEQNNFCSYGKKRDA